MSPIQIPVIKVHIQELTDGDKGARKKPDHWIISKLSLRIILGYSDENCST